MLSTLRKFRKKYIKKNLYKYLVYVIGEMFLIVIGILIAIQINSCSHNKNTHKTSKLYLQALNIEIKNNLTFMNAVLKSTKIEVNETKYYLNELTSSKKINDTLINNLCKKIGLSFSATKSNSVLKDFINSGTINAIKDASLKRRIFVIDVWYNNFENYNKEAEEEWDNHLHPYLNKFCSNSKLQSSVLTTEFFINNNEFFNLLSNHLKVNKSNVSLFTYWIDALSELSDDIDIYLESF